MCAIVVHRDVGWPAEDGQVNNDRLDIGTRSVGRFWVRISHVSIQRCPYVPAAVNRVGTELRGDHGELVDKDTDVRGNGRPILVGRSQGIRVPARRRTCFGLERWDRGPRAV